MIVFMIIVFFIFSSIIFGFTVKAKKIKKILTVTCLLIAVTISVISEIICYVNVPMSVEELNWRRNVASLYTEPDIIPVSDEEIILRAKEIIKVNNAIEWYAKNDQKLWYRFITKELGDYTKIKTNCGYDNYNYRLTKAIEIITALQKDD